MLSPSRRHSAARRTPAQQSGFLLIEGMIAVLIFAIGILGMVAMAGTALGSQTDSRVRTQAAALTSEIANQIVLKVDRTSAAAFATSLAGYAHQATGAPDNCSFSGGDSGDPLVLAWVAKVLAGGLDGLPGSLATGIQIAVDQTVTSHNRVQVTVCWRAPSDIAARRHTLVTYVNVNI